MGPLMSQLLMPADKTDQVLNWAIQAMSSKDESAHYSVAACVNLLIQNKFIVTLHQMDQILQLINTAVNHDVIEHVQNGLMQSLYQAISNNLISPGLKNSVVSLLEKTMISNDKVIQSDSIQCIDALITKGLLTSEDTIFCSKVLSWIKIQNPNSLSFLDQKVQEELLKIFPLEKASQPVVPAKSVDTFNVKFNDAINESMRCSRELLNLSLDK